MKRLISILLVFTLLILSISVMSVSATTAMDDYKQFVADQWSDEEVQYLPDDIKVELFWQIGKDLYLERIYSEMSLTKMYYYNIDKYLYAANGSADNVNIFDRADKKEYSVYDAYEKDVISKSDLKVISQMLKNLDGVKLEENIISIKVGESASLEDINFKWKSKNKKIAAMMNKEKIGNKIYNIENVVGLQKGTATFYYKTPSGKEATCKVTVTSNPKLSKNKVTVQKGKTVKIKISGKAQLINNAYTNTKYAKITSDKTSDTITVKGLKKGDTTVKIKVNGVKTLKLKVKVK